jgi:hypothetical protein
VQEKLQKYLKPLWTSLVGLGVVTGVVLATIQIYDYFFSDEVIEYRERYIPLAYEDSTRFQEFLLKNSGNTVKFNTTISFDLAIGINYLIHKVCEYDSILEAIRKDPNRIAKTPIGLPKFKDGFSGDVEVLRHDFDEKTASMVSCFNHLVIRVKEPNRLRLSYGGTGMVDLPLNGTFIVEVRHFSGPSIEFTLREI